LGGEKRDFSLRLTPSAEFSALYEYVWLMEKLEESSDSNRKIFERYAKNYHPWLGDVEIYFVSDEGEIQKIRDAAKLYV